MGPITARSRLPNFISDLIVAFSMAGDMFYGAWLGASQCGSAAAGLECGGGNGVGCVILGVCGLRRGLKSAVRRLVRFRSST